MQRFRKEIFHFKQHIFAIGIEIQSQCCVVVDFISSSWRLTHNAALALLRAAIKIIFVSLSLSTVLLFSRFYTGSPQLGFRTQSVSTAAHSSRGNRSCCR